MILQDQHNVTMLILSDLGQDYPRILNPGDSVLVCMAIELFRKVFTHGSYGAIPYGVLLSKIRPIPDFTTRIFDLIV